MKNRHAVWLWLLAAILAGLTAWMVWPRQPTYEGRSLSAWLDDLSPPPGKLRRTNVAVRTGPGSPAVQVFAGLPPSAEQDARRFTAGEALRAMGSNALPFLLEQMNARDSAFKKKLMNLASRQSILPVHWRNAAERRRQAIAGIFAVGKPAMPIMEQLLEEKEFAFDAALGLARIGPEALQPLMRAFTNDNKLVRDAAVAGLSRMRNAASRIVPTMMEQLSDSDAVYRKNAAMILGNLGAEAKPAVRLLVKMLSDEETHARDAAAEALKKIDAGTAEQAEVR